MQSSSAVTLIIALALGVTRSEIISDLTVDPLDETKALEIKADTFWKSVLEAAQSTKMVEHAQLYKDVETATSELSSKHAYVKQALTEALSHLRNADNLVFKETMGSATLATEQLHAPIAGSGKAAFSFFSGGQMLSIFRDSLKRFANEGTYPERLVELVEQRQADILPTLQGQLAISSDVISDCRTAKRRSFDVLKHDVYDESNLRGSQKTPEKVKALANRLIDAAGDTRHRFMTFVTGTINSIAQDAQGKHDGAAATVTRATIEARMQTRVPFVGSIIDI
jgi:hypothetical protein